MSKQTYQINDRVEYAYKHKIYTSENLDKGKVIVERRFAVGYVKRIYRKRFATYFDIYEPRTRRVDTVRLRDIFGVAEKQCYVKPSINKNNNF